MSSFNVYGSTHTNVGGSIPVWLGKVSPRPIGGVFADGYATKGTLYKAGAPVYYDASARTITPYNTASGASNANEPNAYLYNDVYIAEDGAVASGAVVQFHAEGILIDRTPSASIKTLMATNVPGVLQVSE